MRKIMLISYGTIVFLLNTFILVYFFFFFRPMDSHQQLLIGMLNFFGYAACGIVYYVLRDEYKAEKNTMKP